MKKLLTISLFSGIVLAGVAFSSTVHAADTNATIGFSAGNLTLDQAPNFDFGSITIGSADSKDATGDQALQVTDYRGNYAGWKVSVALTSDFLDTTTSTRPALAGVTLALNNAAVTGTPTGVSAAGTTVTSTAAIVFDATANNGGNTSAATYGATLSGLTNSGAHAGDSYEAELTWTISDTPK